MIDQTTTTTTDSPPTAAEMNKSANPTMVLGIVGTSVGVTVGFLIGIVPFILGIVGLIAWRHTPGRCGRRTAGLVLGVINVTLGGVWTLGFTLSFLTRLLLAASQ